MEFSRACERVGGQLLDPNTCRVGRNVVVRLDDFNYKIITPLLSFRVRSPSVKVSGSSLRFFFNNCGVEVDRENVEVACFAPGKDNDLNVYFEEVFKAVI